MVTRHTGTNPFFTPAVFGFVDPPKSGLILKRFFAAYFEAHLRTAYAYAIIKVNRHRKAEGVRVQP